MLIDDPLIERIAAIKQLAASAEALAEDGSGTHDQKQIRLMQIVLYLKTIKRTLGSLMVDIGEADTR